MESIEQEPGGEDAAPWSERSDSALVRALQSREPSPALGELIRRHQIPLFRHLSSRLPDVDEAERLCGKVFLLAVQRIEECDVGEAGARDWLLSIASEVLHSAATTGPDLDEPRFVDPAIYFRYAVHRALSTLPEDERDLLLRVDLEDESIEVVAEESGLGLRQATEKLERARDGFREALANSEVDSVDEEDQGELGALVSGLDGAMRPGTLVDRRYLVQEMVGEGGMGAVYRATHVAIKRDVALKTLHASGRTEAMLRERFEREAEVLGKLNHENFVDVSDFGEGAGGIPFLVMELLDGHPLAEELKAGAVTPARALELTRQVLTGLAFAHDNGIVHRDIKPENLLIVASEGASDTAKILDLGIATTTGANAEEALFGTPEYMSPEQIQGLPLDGRSDLYAVGVVLYELLTGDIPFAGSTVEATLAKQLTVIPSPLSEVVPELEHKEVFQGLLDRLMAKDPDRRFRTAEEANAAVVSAMKATGASGGTTTDFQPSGNPARTLPSLDASGSGFTPARVALVFAVLFVLAALTTWLVLG